MRSIAAVTAAALAATGLLLPISSTAQAAGPSAATATTTTRQPTRSLVTLLTGDRVLLRTDSDGRTTASLTPGSPHYGKPVATYSYAGHTYVIPKLPLAQRRTLDNSVFDVTSLAQAGTSARLSMRFAHDTARRSAKSAPTSYDPTQPISPALESSLSSASRVSGPASTTVADPGDYQLRTVTFNVTNASGRPAPYANLTVLNVDDGRLFIASGAAFDGEWKVSMPEGHYSVVTDDFMRVVVDEFTVAGADVTQQVDLGDATVKPTVTYAGHRALDKTWTMDRMSEKHGGLSAGYGGILPRVSPQPKPAAGLGTLSSTVAMTFGPKGMKYDDPFTDVALTKESMAGIPRKISYTYHPGDFAPVALRQYATGPKHKTYEGWYGWAPGEQFAFVSMYRVDNPGLIRGHFQADPGIRWLTSASYGWATGGEIHDTRRVHRGEHAEVNLFRGPVGPGQDSAGESGATGRYCLLCVSDGKLHGLMPMYSSAGTDQVGALFGRRESSWQLRQGRTTLARGTAYITPYVKAPAAGKRLTLSATASPTSPNVTLSTKVSDTWTFTAPAHDAVLPILRARYAPPTDLASQLAPGRVHFPLAFDNLGPVDSRVVAASVRWSVDGKHWKPAKLKRLGKAKFRVSYVNPDPTRRHRTVSLRVSGKDAAGRTVVEEARNAYALGHTKRSPADQTQTARTFHPRTLCRTASTTRYSCFVKLDRASVNGAKAPGADPGGWGAAALRAAYDLPADGADTTVAVVVAYDYPHAEKDLNSYRAQYGLPPCTSASGCFKKINQRGEEGNYPHADPGWSVEAALDMQMISTACPTCKIVLAEANSPYDAPLDRAVDAAVKAGATVTNHSYGAQETKDVTKINPHYAKPGVTAVAATGDYGYQPASFPASSPDVVAVGGTTLARSLNQRGWTEKVWSDAGSGCSAYFAKPAWQTDTSCHMRSFADVSAVSMDIAVYITSVPRPYRGWLVVGGTSASSPLIAGMIGAAGAGGLKPGDLYGHPGDYNDVVKGSNGYCRGNYICTGVPGYDGPTGWGTPKGLAPFIG